MTSKAMTYRFEATETSQTRSDDCCTRISASWQVPIIALLAAGATLNVSAQTNPETTLPVVTIIGTKIGSTAEPGSLLAPSTAGSRLELTPLETPASVSTIPKETIRSLGLTTVLEAKTLAPGITSSNNPGNGGNLLNARGFSGQNSVKQLYNGLEIFNAGGVVSFPFDPWNIERIEALSGPASVLYGTGAIGGAVNVVPRRPTAGKVQTDVALGVGSFGSLHQAVGSTGYVGDSTEVSYRFDVSNRSADNWVDRSKSTSIAVSGSLRYDFSPTLSFIASADYGKQNPMHYLGTPIFNGAPALGTLRQNYNIADSDLFFQDQWLTFETNWLAGSGALGNVMLSNKTYAVQHNRRYRDATIFTFQPPINNVSATVRRTSYRDIGFSLQKQVGTQTTAKFEGSLGGMKNDFLAGFEINRNTYDRHDNVRGGSSTVDAFNPVPGNFRTAYQMESKPFYYMTLAQLGLFVENRLTINDQLSAVVGLRADKYNTDREDRLVPKLTKGQLDSVSASLGLVYQPIKNLSLYGQVATASDPVNSLASIGANQQGFGLSKGQQFELGIKQATANNALEWTLAAYRIVKNDLLTTNLANPSLSEQVGQQSSRGVEASVSAQLGAGLRLVLNGSVVDPKFDQFNAQVGNAVVSLAGKVPVNVHKKSANLLLFWDVAPGWKANASWRYVGERFTNNTNTAMMPGYSVVNVGASWAFNAKTLIEARAENILNKTYATQGSTTQWILGRPRAFWVTGTYAF